MIDIYFKTSALEAAAVIHLTRVIYSKLVLQLRSCVSDSLLTYGFWLALLKYRS